MNSGHDTPLWRQIEALWHQEIMGEWQPGTAGNADLVRFDGQDIVGIARFGNEDRIKLVCLLYNNAREIVSALRWQRSETIAPVEYPMLDKLRSWAKAQRNATPIAIEKEAWDGLWDKVNEAIAQLIRDWAPGQIVKQLAETSAPLTAQVESLRAEAVQVIGAAAERAIDSMVKNAAPQAIGSPEHTKDSANPAAAAGGVDASCFTCGHVGEPEIWLIDHPEVYVCKDCMDKLRATDATSSRRLP